MPRVASTNYFFVACSGDRPAVSGGTRNAAAILLIAVIGSALFDPAPRERSDEERGQLMEDIARTSDRPIRRPPAFACGKAICGVGCSRLSSRSHAQRSPAAQSSRMRDTKLGRCGAQPPMVKSTTRITPGRGSMIDVCVMPLPTAKARQKNLTPPHYLF